MVARAGLMLGVVLAACGSGAITTHPGADRATAAAINLTPDDLPAGFQPGPAPDPTTGSLPAKLARCAGAPDPAHVDVVEVSSPTFTAAVGQAQEQLSSEVTMVRTETDAAADLTALRSSRLAGCLRSQLGPALRAQLPVGTSLGAITVSHFSPPGAGAVGLRALIPVLAGTGGSSASVDVTADLITFAVGRAEVTLTARATGPAQLGPEEARLIARLAGRAKATRQAA